MPSDNEFDVFFFILSLYNIIWISIFSCIFASLSFQTKAHLNTTNGIVDCAHWGAHTKQEYQLGWTNKNRNANSFFFSIVE